MFRKPRDSTGLNFTPLVGRAPSPPNKELRLPKSPEMSRQMATARPARLKSAQKHISSFFGKISAAEAQEQRQGKKTNESILKFFQKVDAPAHFERDLFVGSTYDKKESVVCDTLEILNDDEPRYNENGGSIKRSRTSLNEQVSRDSILPGNGRKGFTALSSVSRSPSTEDSKSESPRVTSNPFAEDSETENEEAVSALKEEYNGDNHNIKSEDNHEISADLKIDPLPVPPPLLQKDTTWNANEDTDEFGEFEVDEFYEDGEEYVERRYMEEQAALEQEFEKDDDLNVETKPDLKLSTYTEATCPLCNTELDGFTEQEVSVHVNKCLDGNPDPSPTSIEKEEKSIVISAKRFQRSAIPRPGQASPHPHGSSGGGCSAFSKLMSSHAEDEAWATAAANEMAARGKPAFKRICPFYKILPGLFTCVDAFRYGAVEGCNAYFLSHFHSDHYIGLTSTWCHGPIYCSKVTGNLVRQQLRVDPRWVVDLEWEIKTEVPKTEGVFVTMISANHCPGSSLFLFEKVMTRGNGNSKLQRTLHCGDFRACPAHVQHPLLRPDVVDAVGGHSRQQKLDVCYLDTTYLTPKYAFPSQDTVIQACADMCVSLSKDQVDEMDTWEKTKKARAGSGMAKFVQKDVGESLDEKNQPKGRGRLLVICGTYSIGKERICVGIARALKTKIYAPAGKRRICLALEDPELKSLLTDDPQDAQIHMQMLMEIRPETLADYLTTYKPHFSRIVGFRPTGWSYRPPNSRFVESPLVQTVLHSDNWKSLFTMTDLIPQRGSTKEASCFGVPYSEHSSFRELTMFCCALRIDKIIPTVNIGSAKSREKMKAWIEKWNNDKKKHGLFKVDDEATAW